MEGNERATHEKCWTPRCTIWRCDFETMPCPRPEASNTRRTQWSDAKEPQGSVIRCSVTAPSTQGLLGAIGRYLPSFPGGLQVTASFASKVTSLRAREKAPVASLFLVAMPFVPSTSSVLCTTPAPEIENQPYVILLPLGTIPKEQKGRADFWASHFPVPHSSGYPIALHRHMPLSRLCGS